MIEMQQIFLLLSFSLSLSLSLSLSQNHELRRAAVAGASPRPSLDRRSDCRDLIIISNHVIASPRSRHLPCPLRLGHSADRGGVGEREREREGVCVW